MLMMILKRMMMAVPSLIGVVIVTFLLTRALPGDPAGALLGERATPEALERVREAMGLNKPLIEQVHVRSVLPRCPHGQGFSAATSMKSAG